MRTLFWTLVLVAVSGRIHGQGTFNFANTPDSLVRYQASWVPFPPYPPGYPQSAVVSAPVDGARVEVLWAPVGTTDIGLFQSLGPVVSIGPIAGRFVGGTRTVLAGSGFSGIAPGGVVSLVVRAWIGTASTWFEAVNGPNFSYPFGYSNIFTVDTGDPTTNPSGTPASLAGSFTGLDLYYIPEPTGLALGSLAGVALVGLKNRRR